MGYGLRCSVKLFGLGDLGKWTKVWFGGFGQKWEVAGIEPALPRVENWWVRRPLRVAASKFRSAKLIKADCPKTFNVGSRGTGEGATIANFPAAGVSQQY